MKILVVDDSRAVRMQIRQELEEEGYEVYEAEDGVDAFKILLNLKPDLITLDVEMPNMDGFETCQKLRSSRYSQIFTTSSGGRIPVIFITSVDSLEERARGFEAGAADFIVKPFQKGEIREAVNRRIKPQNILEGLTAIIAEDNRKTRYIVSDFLRLNGVTVLEYGNGQDAYDYISAHLDSVDLVITDLEMPEMGGDELCAKIRGDLSAPDIPVVFLTVTNDQDRLLELFDAGATDYIMKPFVIEELIARLKVHLQVRLLNRELKQRMDSLKRMDRIKNQFLAACSHDLRSPLNGILGLVDVMIDTMPLEDDAKHMLSIIRQSSNYLSTLIAEILDLHMLISQEQELEMEPVSIHALAESCLETLNYMAYPKNIELHLLPDSTPQAMVLGDGLALKRVINNLVSNAIKFTPRGGKITVAIDAPTAKSRSFSVTDTGTGIPEKKLAQMMEKQKIISVKGTEGEQGTGLGLAIVKEIIRKHNGELKISSEVGKGSVFTMILPAEPR